MLQWLTQRPGMAIAAGVSLVLLTGGGWFYWRAKSQILTPPGQSTTAQRSVSPPANDGMGGGVPRGSPSGGDSARRDAPGTPAKPKQEPAPPETAKNNPPKSDSPAPSDVGQPKSPEIALAGDEVLVPQINGHETGPKLPPFGEPQTASRPAPGDHGAPALNSSAPPTPQTKPASGTQPPEKTGDAHPALKTARQRYEAGQALEARRDLNTLLKKEKELPPADQTETRALLARIVDETVFSRKRAKDDPLTDEYVVKPGDALVRIARQYDVPPEALMLINGIKNPAALRADHKIKVVRGPFHAKIHKSQFRLDVYLQDTYVRSYPVGLGGVNGTPEGVWQVKNRLKNPTYFPSASAPEKKVIAADDPNNPLGEYWIGLEGVDGAAVGQEGYGIHGTIEPDSIGKAASLGCVRMHNQDVEFVYSLLLPGKSTVTVLP